MRFALTALLFAASLAATSADEGSLSAALATGDQAKAKRKYGPYVGVSAGATLGQEGTVRVGNRTLPLNDTDGAAIFNIEVGKSWKMKRLPIMTSVEVEGTFMSTNLSGSVPTAGLAPTDVAQYEADMNSLFFSLNGTFSLDLYRYRARIGKFLAGFRPYVGGGLGGGQVWYRNATARSASQVGGGTQSASSNPFSIDEFINTWNWNVGMEWTWKDQYSVFFEYRDFHVGDLEDLTDFSTDGYLIGFRYRY